MTGRGRLPTTESEIVGADWCTQDLSGHSHAGVAFIEADLSETTGRGAHFSDCVFRDCRLNSAQLSDVALLNCTFTRCSFFGASLRGCKLVGSTFDRCRLEELLCEGGDWSFAGLPGADLRRARFIEVRMREVDLTGANCAGTLMRGVDLSGAVLHRTDFSGADLRGSDLSSLDPAAARLQGTIIDPAQAMTIAAVMGLDVRPEAGEEEASSV